MSEKKSTIKKPVLRRSVLKPILPAAVKTMSPPIETLAGVVGEIKSPGGDIINRSEPFILDIAPFGDIERQLDNFKGRIKQEKNLILQTTYALNYSGSKWLCVGLSPAQDFQAVVKITNYKPGEGIHFNQPQWTEFLTYENKIMEYFDGKSNIEFQSLEDHVLDFTELYGEKIMKLTWEKVGMYLGEVTVRNLFRLRNIVSYHLLVLSNLNFHTFYVNNIRHAQNIDKLTSNINATPIENSHVLGINEMWMYFKDKLINDLTN